MDEASAEVQMVKSQAVPVAVVARPGTGYPADPPFAPPNPVYDMVEAALRDLGLDRARAGTPEWNPLGDLIRPGDRVLIKAGLGGSRSADHNQPLYGEPLLCSSTPGAVLRPILDYALRAAGKGGHVTVADTPPEGCNIGELLRHTGIDSIIADSYAHGRAVEFIDLRTFQLVPHLLLDDAQHAGRSCSLGVLRRERLPGDPLGYTVLDVGDRSRFCEVERRAPRLRSHRGDPLAPLPHHAGGRHEYAVGRTVLAADVVINLAKLKTDQQAGVALSLASALTLNSEPHWLPRYTAGTPDEDGDEYPARPPLGARITERLQRLPLAGTLSLVARAPRLSAPQNGLPGGYIVEGAWEGNDTLWRAALDLSFILLHADKEGRLSDTPQRRYLTLLDGIVGGEGDGPLALTPRRAGLLVAGQDPVLTDLAAARLMGMEPARVPTLSQALKRPLLASSREAALVLSVSGTPGGGAFIPPSTWPRLLRK